MIESEVNKIKSFLSEQQDVLLAYLYGSQVEGVARKNSDVDIAVLIDEKQVPASPYGRDVNLARKIDKIIQKKTDLRLLNQAAPFFVFQVLRKGQLLFAKNEDQRAEFESRARCKYFDLKPLYKMFSDEMEQRLKKGEYGVRPQSA